jgi:hypothetical protein
MGGWRDVVKGATRVVTAPIKGGTHALLETGRGAINLDPGRVLTAPIKGAGHTLMEQSRGITTGITGGAVSLTPSGFLSSGTLAARAREKLKMSTRIKFHGLITTPVAGSDYFGATKKEILGIQQSFAWLWQNRTNSSFSGGGTMTPAEIQSWPTLVNNAYKASTNVWYNELQNALIAARGGLSSSTSQEVHNFILGVQDIKKKFTGPDVLPLTKQYNSELYNKGVGQIDELLNKLQTKRTNLQEAGINTPEDKQLALMQEAKSATALDPKKLILPAALGIGAILALKG